MKTILVSLLIPLCSLAWADPVGRLAPLLSNEVEYMKDSEFSISFYEDYGTARKIGALSKDLHPVVHGTNGQHASIQATEYGALIHQLLRFKESEFDGGAPKPCLEPFVFRIRVGKRTESFHGCRGDSSNSSTASHLARDLEFFIAREAK